jgi:ABC-type nitrate/sulfonate/bicarbonate transport system substrate-binding protein
MQIMKKLLACVAAFSIAAFSGVASAEPLKIRIGHGSAAEEQLWLMAAMPEIGRSRGKAYELSFNRFAGADKRFQAFEAGEIDLATGSANSILLAASEGIDMKAIASISQESRKGFFTQYKVRSNVGVNSIQDLKGKTIGINGLNSSIHLWAILALRQAGLNPDRDVRFVLVPFPAQGESLRAGRIDVGAFPQPFAKMEADRGGLQTVFTSKDGVPFDEELILLVAKSAFLEKNRTAVRAFLADLVAATDFYIKNPKVARQALIDAKFVRLKPDTYFAMQDYYRAPDARINLESLEKSQALQINAGWQKTAADVKKLVDMSFLP